MIEIQFDADKIDEALRRLHGSRHLLSRAVGVAVRATAPEVRRTVIGVLENEVLVGRRSGTSATSPGSVCSANVSCWMTTG